MNSPKPDSEEPLSKEELLEIEKKCDEFERDLRSQLPAWRLHSDDFNTHLEQVKPKLRGRLKIELQKIVNEKGGQSEQLATPSYQGTPNSTLRGIQGPAERDSREQLQSRVPERFQLVRYLGEGATAVVWLAEDRQLHRQVAMKIAHHGSSVSEPKGFQREARSSSRLKHPHIVRVLETAAGSDWPYLVYEFVDGESLSNRLAREMPEPELSARWVAALADALSYAHEQGVVHRDIKPQNILIDGENSVYLTDFGIAKDYTDREATRTRTGLWIGTPAYMSPQQASGQMAATPADDIYALGVVFYKLLTGEVPFHGNAQSVMLQLMHTDPRPIRESQPSVAWELELLCMNCLEKKPSDRMASAAFLRDEIQRYLRGEPILSRPATWIQKIAKWTRRNPRLSQSIAASFTLMVLLTISSLLFSWKLSISWKQERDLRLAAMESESRSRQAMLRERIALEKAQHEVAVSSQVVNFMESIFQSNDPVYWLLTEPGSGKLPTLQSVLDNAAERSKSELKDQPQIQARLFDILANAYRSTGYSEEALDLLTMAEEVRGSNSIEGEERNREENAWDVAIHSYYLGCWHHDQGDFDAAHTHYIEAIRNLSDHSLESPRLQLTLSDVEFQLGRMSIDQKDYSAAIPWIKSALHRRQEHLAGDSPRVRSAEIALMLCRVTDPSKWPEQLASMIGDESTWYEKIAMKFAHLTLVRASHPPEKVKPLFESLIRSLDESLTLRHPISLLALGDYASWLHSQGEYRSAYPITKQLIETANTVAPNHSKLADAKIHFAFELIRSNRLEEADQLYREALAASLPEKYDLTEAKLGHLWCSLALGKTSSMAILATELIDSQEGRSFHAQAWCAYAAARCFQMIGEPEKARQYDALALKNVLEIESIPENSLWLERLSTIYSSQGELPKAETLLKRAVEWERSNRPPKHPRLADRLLGLGGILERQSKYQEAISVLSEALDIYLDRMPDGDRRIDAARETLERNRERLNDPSQKSSSESDSKPNPSKSDKERPNE